MNIAVADNAPVTSLPAGTYTVTAHGINGFSVGPQNTWTQPDHRVLEPEGCEKIAIPVTHDEPDGVHRKGRHRGFVHAAVHRGGSSWYVNNQLKTTPSTVFFPGDVVVEARITQAGKDAGVFFTDGTQSVTVTHKFVLRRGGLHDSTLALLTPDRVPDRRAAARLCRPTRSPTPRPSTVASSGRSPAARHVAPGTYQASWGSTVTATATLVDPELDGFAPEQKTVWDFPFPAKPATCGDLVTLALTGATGGFVLWIAGAMLLLGGAGIYLTRRLILARR